MVRNNPTYVDLHGWREEEVAELLDSVARMIKEQANLSTSSFTQATKRFVRE